MESAWSLGRRGGLFWTGSLRMSVFAFSSSQACLTCLRQPDDLARKRLCSNRTVFVNLVRPLAS